MLNKALLLANNKANGEPTLTVDLRELPTGSFNYGTVFVDGSYNENYELSAGSLVIVPISILTTLSQYPAEIDVPVGGHSIYDIYNIEEDNITGMTEYYSGQCTYYFGPDDWSKSAQIKVSLK